MERRIDHSYDDILDRARPPRRQPCLSREQRAAQFSPFAALAGHGAALDESARLTEAAVELAEDAAAALDEKQRILCARLAERPPVTVTWFVPDARKEGGAFRTHSGRLRAVDEAAGLLVLEDGERIPLNTVRALESPLFPEFL